MFNPRAPYDANYTPVSDTFSILPGDLFRFGEFTSPSAKYYEVDYTYSSPSKVVVFKNSGSINPSVITPESFAILRKVPDETSIILNYNKTEGDTSKALAIPSNLERVVADNVANIIQPLRVALSTQ